MAEVSSSPRGNYLVLWRHLDALTLKDTVHLQHKLNVVKLLQLKGMALSKIMCILSKSLQVISLGRQHLHIIKEEFNSDNHDYIKTHL